MKNAGFTLIELLVVMAIVALITTAATYGFGTVDRASLRSSGMKILAASKYAYGRSVARGTTVRVLLDFNENTIAIEESESPVTLTTETSQASAGQDDKQAGAIDPWAAAEAKIATSIDLPAPISPFSPITSKAGKIIQRFQPKKFPSRVELVRLISPHEPDPREEGIGAIYYFPGGIAEQSIVHLQQGETSLSVIIDQYTGSGRIEMREVETSKLSDELELASRRESLEPPRLSSCPRWASNAEAACSNILQYVLHKLGTHREHDAGAILDQHFRDATLAMMVR